MNLRVDLEKELDKEKEKTQIDAIVTDPEIKLLTEGNFNEEKETLRQIGLGTSISAHERRIGINIERKKFEDQYKGKAFTRSEIEILCIKYDLRFLKSKKYQGAIDLKLGTVLNEFRKKNELNLESYDADNFYIMCTAKSFNLRNKPRLPKGDPVIFYKMPNRAEYDGAEDHFVFVHKWGLDFTITRWLRSLYRESSSQLWLGNILFFWTIWVAIFSIGIPTLTFEHYIFCVPIAAAFGAARIALKYGGEDWANAKLGSQIFWDSDKNEKLNSWPW